MNAALLITLSASFVALLLIGSAAFQLRKAKLIPTMAFLVTLIIVYLYILFEGNIENSTMLVVMEFTPIIAWKMLFLTVYKKEYIQKTWRWILGGFWLIGTVALIVLFVNLSETEELYRQLYITPLVALTYLFTILRIIQDGQKKAVGYMVLITFAFATSVYFVSAIPVVYFIAATGAFTIVSVVLAFALQTRDDLDSSIFGDKGQLRMSQTKRNYIEMILIFCVIFLISLFVLYVVARALFMRKLEVNLNFQSYVIEQTLDETVQKNRELLEAEFSQISSENISIRLQEIQKIEPAIVGLGIEEQGIQKTEPDSIEKIAGTMRLEKAIDSGTLMRIYSNQELQDPVLEITKEHQGKSVQLITSLRQVFNKYENAGTYDQAEIVGLISIDGEIISFPLRPPYDQGEYDTAATLSNICAEAVAQCEGGECTPYNRRFLAQRMTFENELIGNSTIASPDLGMCVTTQLKQNETVIAPRTSEGVLFVVTGFILIFTFMLSAAALQHAINKNNTLR